LLLIRLQFCRRILVALRLLFFILRYFNWRHFHPQQTRTNRIYASLPPPLAHTCNDRLGSDYAPQGLADASNQVDWMMNIVQPGLKTCPNCASVMFKYDFDNIWIIFYLLNISISQLF
jgi:hypothetical protein